MAEERFCKGIYWDNKEKDWKVFSKGKFIQYAINNNNSIMDGYIGIVAMIELPDGHLEITPVEKIVIFPLVKVKPSATITITIRTDEGIEDSQIHKFVSDAKELINSLGNKAFKIKDVTIH